MQNYQKQDRRGVMNQPNIIMFASPSVTPSNNYKSGGNYQKDLNSSQIQGRKVDSPQLRIMKDLSEGNGTAGNSQSIGQARREDFTSLFNFQPVNELNHTNKEIQKKQFDFGVKQQKGNITIQYDSYDPPRGASQHQRQSSKGNKSGLGGHPKKNKHALDQYGRKRQQSQSAPKQSNLNQGHQQQVVQIVNNQAPQPLINLHIQNAKMAKNSVFNYPKHKQQPDTQTAGKYQTNPLSNGNTGHSTAQKHRSKSKNRQKSAGNRSSITGQVRDQMNKSNAKYKYNFLNQSLLNQDNKENQSINNNEFSPVRANGGQQKPQQYLDSDSSLSSPIGTENKIAQKLEKSYFMDKSSLLKHLSPDRQRSQSKSKAQVQPQQLLMNPVSQNGMSDRDKSKKQSAENTGLIYKSNNSTIIQQPLQVLNPNVMNPMGDSNKNINFKIKRPLTGSSINNKLFIKGVDKIIRENLKKNRTKEEEEISRRYLEDFKQKLKKIELSQRNQQVRKINASKIIYNHQHKNSQVNKISVQKIIYKKQRSKSCMKKTDSIFGGFNKPRSKERLPKNNNDLQQPVPQQLAPSVQPIQIIHEHKKEKKREKSLVLELRELKKQIDGEIRREIMAGKLEVQPISAANKRTNLTTINAKKDTSQTRKKNQDSKEEIAAGDVSNNLSKSRRKSKSKEHVNKSISQNIKKFIKNKKHAEIKLKSLEQTIENQKHEKRKENLQHLKDFVKNHFRQKSYYVYNKPNQEVVIVPKVVEQEQPKQKKTKTTLKPKFFVEKNQKHKYEHSPMPKENDISVINNNNQNDISQEMLEDYQKTVSLINKGQKRSKDGRTPKKQSPAQNMQVHDMRRREQQQSKEKKVRISPKRDSLSGDESQMTAFKNEIIHQMPNVAPEKVATLIPPQSDIATLDKNQFDKSSKIDQSTEPRRTDKKSQDSEKHLKSPQKDKMRVLMQMYGHNIPRSQLQKPAGETKLLIKLHSAAITIQQFFRKTLFASGFYENEQTSQESSKYVNSDEEEELQTKQFTSKYQKNVPQQLVATTSPLRVRAKAESQKQQEEERKTNNFYSADSSDMEKVVVWSVITSGRPEGDDSLSNTQKYVPLRQKPSQPQKSYLPQPSSITSSANSGFNTAIKAQPLPLQQRIPEQNKDQSQLDISTTSQRRFQIPSLDFDKLTQENKNKQTLPKILDIHEEHKGHDGAQSSTRSIFDKHGFQELLQKMPKGEVNLNGYPEMMKIREQAIQLKHQQDEEMLRKKFKAQQISPRTFDIKKKDLEVWVEKEREDVKRAQQVFEEMFKKTASIIEETKNSDLLKRMLDDQQKEQKATEGRSVSKPYEDFQGLNANQIILSNRTQQSSRRQPVQGFLEEVIQKDEAQRHQNTVQEQPSISKVHHINKHEEPKVDLFKLLERERIEAMRQEEQLLQKQQQEQEEADRAMKQRVAEENSRIQAQKEHERRKQEEIQRKRDEEQQRLKREEEERKKQEQQKKLEQERKQREIEDQQRKIEDERLRKERELKQKQEKEENDRREKERLAQEKAKREAEEELARKNREKEEQKAQQKREKEAKERELEQKRQQREAKEQEKKRKDEEFRKKMEATERRLEQNRLNKASPSPQPIKEEPLIQTRPITKETPKDISPPKAVHQPIMQQENDSSDELEFFRNQITQKQVDPRRGKEVLESQEDSKQSESLQNIIQNAEVREEDHKLSRTRSSQQIVPDNENEDSNEEYNQEVEKKENLDSPFDLQNLNNRSIDEDPFALSTKLRDPNFFTKDFDEREASSYKERIASHQQPPEKIEEEKPKSIGASQIYVEDKGEEVNSVLDHQSVHSSFNTQGLDRANNRNLQQLIAAEYVEESKFQGQPVSPASDLNNRNPIVTGSQSLVSTLSDDQQMKEAIHEANIEHQEIQQKTDKITDDVFKILMDELRLELDLLLLNVPKKESQQQAPQEHLMNESGRFLIFERRGIKTDLFAIERYVEEVLEEVLKERTKFTSQIQIPLSRNAREVLNQLQNSEIGSYEHFDINYPPVLPLELYLKLEKRRKENREQNQQQSENPTPGQDRNLLAECEHIHNKVLFDCINDSLLQFKPYGKDGAPLAWSRQNRRLRPMEEFTVEEMFEIVKHDLFRWAIMQAGTLPRKEFVFGGVFDDELFAEIREKKLATLLAREMIETEPKWLNYEFEEAQVKIDIGDMILEQLVTETITILRQNQANLH